VDFWELRRLASSWAWVDMIGNLVGIGRAVSYPQLSMKVLEFRRVGGYRLLE
jgi:hypothetical protein